MFLSLFPSGAYAVTSVNPTQGWQESSETLPNLNEKEIPKPRFQSYRGPEESNPDESKIKLQHELPKEEEISVSRKALYTDTELQVEEPNLFGVINNPTGEITSLAANIYIKRLTLDGRGWSSESRFTSSGEFAFYLPDGEYYLSAVPQDYGDLTSSLPERVVIKDGAVIEPTGSVILKFSEPQVSGLVVDEAGTFLSGVEVEFYYNSEGEDWQDTFYRTQWVTTNSLGQFQVGGLMDGTYDVTTYTENGESYQVKAYVRNGQYDGPTEIEVMFYNLVGTVNKPNGTPFDGGNVEIRPQSFQGGYYGWTHVDDQGNFKAVVPEGEYYIRAIAPQNSPFTNSLVEEVQLNELGQTPQNLNLTDPLVQGTIKYSDGLVPDVYISITDEDGYELDWTESDSAGAFKLGGVLPGSYILNVDDWRSNRYLSQDIEVTSESVLNLELSFPDPNVVGTVYDPENNSLPNITVDIYQNQGDYGYNGSYGTESDESGQYELYLEDGEYYLVARPEPSSPYSRSFSKKIIVNGGICQTTDLSLSLTDPIFTGKVLDSNNQPVSNITVYLNPEGNNNEGSEFFNNSWMKTDSNGTFRFGGISDGYYEIYANGPQGESLSKSVKIENGISDSEFIELNLLPITVRGQVFNSDGTPAYFPDVEFEPLGQEGTWKHVSTDSDGYYEAALMDGDYLVSALANPDSEYTNSYETQITIEDGRVITKDLYLTNPKLTGRVLDSNLYPVPYVWVSIHSEDRTYWSGTPTNSSGNYKFGGLASGNYVLQVQGEGIYSKEYTTSVEVDSLKTLDITLEAPNVTGIVLGLDNLPTDEVYINFYGSSYSSSGIPVSPDGSFSVALPIGDYKAKAYSKVNDSVESLPQTLLIQDGSAFSDVVFQLKNPMVHGQVLDADTTPVEGVEVGLGPADEETRQKWNMWTWVVTDEQGKFALGVVPDGNYQVEVQSNISQPLTYEVAITDGVAAPTNIIVNLPPANVTGKVVAPDGVSQVEGFGLDIVSSSGPSWYADYNDGDGTFQLSLEDGTYTLWVYPRGGLYDSTSITITIENGQLKAGEDTTIILQKRPLVHIDKPYGQKQLAVKRFSGSDFTGTNLSGIQNGWATSEYAIFVSAENAAEHPAGLLLAGHYGAPLFQISATGLTQPQMDSLKELGVTKVVVIGLLDPSVGTTLTENGITDVTSVVAEDRYATLVEANKLMLGQYAAPQSVIITNSDITNAQLVSGLAGKYGVPVLMADRIFSNSVVTYLQELNPSNIFLMGNSADYRDLKNEIQRVLTGKNLYVYREDDNNKRSIAIGGMIRDNKQILGISYRTDQSLIASDHSILDLTSAANLGARYDTIPLLTATEQPSGDLLYYLESEYWDGSIWMSSPREKSTRLFVVGGTDLISDEAVNILSIGAGYLETLKNYEVRGSVEDNVTLTLNGAPVDIDPYGDFIKSIVLQPGVNKLTFVASRDGETQTIIRYVQYEAPYMDIEASGSLEATVGVSYSVPMNSYGGVAPYTWTIVNQPNWLSIDQTGLVSGTPSEAGSYEFTVTLSDLNQNSISETFQLVVSESQNLIITAPTIPGLNVGTPMTSIQLEATGGSGNYTWSSWGLPTGLTLSPTGLLSGTPLYPGSYFVDLNVIDNSIGLSSSIVTIQILVVNGSTTSMTATPLIQFSGQNPISSEPEPAGIYVGIDEIKDIDGNLVNDHLIAGYTLEIDFNPEQVNVGTLQEVAQLGELVFDEAEKENGLITVSVATGQNETSAYDKLLFIPLTLKGSALQTPSVYVRFLALGDSEANEIGVANSAPLIFQRGKVLSKSNSNIIITDAIGGLQYIAGRRNPGFELNKVNIVNMASIAQTSNEQFADVLDIVELLKYLSKMNNEFFQSN